ncbi:MAG: hypothetical protein H6810_04325 [Phycisphaeraceae bacterium]|nr:MAG: hypothetical protein H6810_04325 [Phycisphaeraceae bacterium]
MTPTLAQLGDWINPSVPALPSPPLLEHLVLESPTLPAVALILGGIVILIALRSRNQTRAGLIACAAAIGVAGVIWTAGSLVETKREHLLALQDRLIEATAHANIAALEPLLASDARARSPGLPMLKGGIDRGALINLVESTLGNRYPVASTGIIERQAVIDGPRAARTQVYLAVQPQDFSKTWAWFAIAWRLDPDGQWRAIEIEPLFISGVLAYGS